MACWKDEIEVVPATTGSALISQPMKYSVVTLRMKRDEYGFLKGFPVETPVIFVFGLSAVNYIWKV